MKKKEKRVSRSKEKISVFPIPVALIRCLAIGHVYDDDNGMIWNTRKVTVEFPASTTETKFGLKTIARPLIEKEMKYGERILDVNVYRSV